MDQSEKNHQEIQTLKKDQAVMAVKIDHINQSINEIKTNHLVHIHDQLTNLNKLITDSNTTRGAEIGKIYESIASINVTNAKREPGNNLLNEVIRYVVLGVIGAVLLLIFK
jgi:hypothetical protein